MRMREKKDEDEREERMRMREFGHHPEYFFMDCTNLGHKK